MLKEIQAQTEAVRSAVEEQREKVDKATQEVESVVREVRDGEVKIRDELKEIREEVDNVREMLPKVDRLSSPHSPVLTPVVEMLEKNKDSQTQSLAELQQEMKSLKALLLSRGPVVPNATVSPLPSLGGRPSIPAWQLATGNSNPPSASWERAPATGRSDANGKGKEINTADSE